MTGLLLALVPVVWAAGCTPSTEQAEANVETTPAAGSSEQAESTADRRPTTSESAASDEPVETDWLLPRGDVWSRGWAPQTLADDLVVRWEYKADEAIETTPVVSGDRVIISDVMGKLYAIDRTSGDELWKIDYDTGFLAAPTIQDDRIYIGDIEGNLYCLDLATGEELWKQTTTGEIYGAAAFHGDNVLFTSQDGSLHCYSAIDGTPLWRYATNDQVRCSPTIVGDRTFLGGCDGNLHIVDVKTGEAVGEPIPLGGPTGSTPAANDSIAVVPIMDGAVFGFDWKNAEQIWMHTDPDRLQEYRSNPAMSDEYAVVSSQFKQIDTFEIATGKHVAKYTLKGRNADASPVIAGDDVWIATTDGRLVRLSFPDLEPRPWNYEIRGSFYAAPAISGNDLLIADDEGVVRCFSPKSDNAG